MIKPNDLTGQRFHYGVVLGFSHSRVTISGNLKWSTAKQQNNNKNPKGYLDAI